MPRIAVDDCSSTGHVRRLAQALTGGAEEAGAGVRLRRVPELAPEEVVRGRTHGTSTPSPHGRPSRRPPSTTSSGATATPSVRPPASGPPRPS
jgi:hypothetical protein